MGERTLAFKAVSFSKAPAAQVYKDLHEQTKWQVNAQRRLHAKLDLTSKRWERFLYNNPSISNSHQQAIQSLFPTQSIFHPLFIWHVQQSCQGPCILNLKVLHLRGTWQAYKTLGAGISWKSNHKTQHLGVLPARKQCTLTPSAYMFSKRWCQSVHADAGRFGCDETQQLAPTLTASVSLCHADVWTIVKVPVAKLVLQICKALFARCTFYALTVCFPYISVTTINALCQQLQRSTWVSDYNIDS